jgi:hypothetical protein
MSMETAMAEHTPTTANSGTEASVDFEREKWRAEMALRERELALKEREGSLFKSPIVVSAIAVFVGLLSNAVSDWITKDRRLAEETRQREAALLVKAFEHNDPNVVMAKLNLLNLTGMISDTNELAKKLVGQEYTEVESKIKSLPSETLRQYQAALIQKAVEADDVDKVLRKLKLLDEANLIPDYDKVRRVYATLSTVAALPVPQATSSAAFPRSIADAPTSTVASASTPAATTPTTARPTTATPTTATATATATPTPTTPEESGTQAASCATATKSLEGWIFLGGIDGSLKRWVVSDSGTRSIEFETPELNAGPGFKIDDPLTKAVMGQCLHTKTAKFLRGEGVDGRRLQAAIKQTLPSGTRLRIVGIDSLGRDDASSARNPVLWARVEILSD